MIRQVTSVGNASIVPQGNSGRHHGGHIRAPPTKDEGAGVFIHQLQSLRVASGSYKFPSTLGLSLRQNNFLNDRESLEKQRILGRQLECARRVRS